MKKQFDKAKANFEGWATKNDLKCSDGRTIRHGAFKGNDGEVVPLVWMHQHNEPFNVLGHALLESREDGVYTYGLFNDTEAGLVAQKLVEHGDIDTLSIYANHLQQNGADVLRGNIREVSLVLAGANPGAYIESVIAHEDGSDEEAVIYTGENITLCHAEDASKSEDGAKTKKPEQSDSGEAEKGSQEKPEDGKKSGDDDYEGKTLKEVFEGFSEDLQNIVAAMIAVALEEQQKKSNQESDDNNKEDDKMKHNAFDQNTQPAQNEDVLTHDDFKAVMSDFPRLGSLRESFLAHGIENVDYLFPEAKAAAKTPETVRRDATWVQNVMNSVHHTPFSKIRTIAADMTPDEARAKGYITGNQKLEQVFGLLKRETSATTVYKIQKLNRDDVNDITEFDVIAWIKSEMRSQLDEEVARAVLIGDGRSAADPSKINEAHIRPIAKDEDLFTIKVSVPASSGMTEDQKAKAFIRAAVQSRKNYKGTGNPSMYVAEDMLTSLRLVEDSIGHLLYDTDEKLARVLRVKEIIPVPVMDNVQGANGGILLAVIVNLADYNVGADKGGSVNMFDDFDLNYNKQEYLIETRCSGALTKPFSAIAIELGGTAVTYTAVTPEEGDNPAAEGWYEKFAGAYTLTKDTAVKSGKTYYTGS